MELIIQYNNLILSQIDKIKSIFLIIIFSFFIRILLQSTGQRWIMTTAHTATLVLLPIITFVITKVISGNIALSLGMVGALSIVRFRHPVRSPLELSVYFGAITMGIAAAVDFRWVLFLLGTVVAALLLLTIVNVASKKILRRPFFSTSFSEGNSLSTLDVTALKQIESLDKSQHLTMKRYSETGINYTLSAKQFEDLTKYTHNMNQDANIVMFQLNRL